MSHPKLRDVVQAVIEVRAECRAEGLSDEVIAARTEQVVRHYWAPFVASEDQWPGWAQAPRCAYCDGTGLVILLNVRDRLGQLVDEGRPCRCPKGIRFLPKTSRDEDHTHAGKTPKKARPWIQAGR